MDNEILKISCRTLKVVIVWLTLLSCASTSVGLKMAHGQTKTDAHQKSLAGTQPRPTPPTFSIAESSEAFQPKYKLTGKPSSSPNLAGQWWVVYYKYPYFQKIKLKLEEPDENGQYQGTAQRYEYRKKGRGGRDKPAFFEESYEGTAVGIANQPSGEMRVYMKFSRGRSSSDSFTITGVADPENSIFGGYVNASSKVVTEFGFAKEPSKHRHREGFLMVPTKEAGTQLIARITELNGNGRQLTDLQSEVRKQIQPDPKLLANIKHWASRFNLEYPDVDNNRTQFQILTQMSANLFADEHFKKYFGITFDQLPMREVARINVQFDYAARGRFDPSLRKELGDYSAFSSHFSTGTFGHKNIIGAMWPKRIVRRWRAAKLDWLKSVEPYAELPEHLEGVEQTFKRQFQKLWPSEQSDGEATCECLYRNAPGIAEAQIAKLIQNPDKVFGMANLQNWRSQLSVPSEALSESDVERFDKLTQNRLTQLVSQQLIEDTKRISEIPDDFNSLKKLRDRRVSYRFNYGGIRDRTEISKLFDYIQRTQVWLIKKHRKTIETLIANAGSDAAIEQIKSTMDVPLARIHPDEFDIFDAAIREKMRQFARTKWESQFSRSELKLMDDNGIIQLPNTPIPPKADDVKLAFVRSTTEVVGKKLSPDSFVTQASLFLPGPDGKPLKVTDRKSTIHDVDLLEDPKKTGQQTFTVRYRLRVGDEYSGVLFDRDNKLTNIINSLTRDLASLGWSDPMEDTFELTKAGWKCPSLKARLYQEPSIALGKILQAMTQE